MGKDNVKPMESQTVSQEERQVVAEGIPCSSETVLNETRIQENLIKCFEHMGIPKNIFIDKPVAKN